MDIKTLLSIYNKPWLVEPSAALQMLDLFERVKAGEMQWSYAGATGKDKDSANSTYSIYQKFFARQDVIMSPGSSWDMEDFKGFDGASVAVIPVNGPIMKSDFCGSFGTNTLSQLTRMASNTDSVKNILFVIDSPGGTVDGTQSFADTIKASGKRTVCLVDGLMCSAAYWIGSSCDEVYASTNTDIIGSIGTMCSMYDTTEAMKSRGVVLREYYATESKDKNRAFTDAQKGDGKALVQEMLDPLNNEFIATVKANRGNKLSSQENVLTGKIYTAQKATELGLIDGVKTMEAVLTGATTGVNNSNYNSSSKNTIMTRQDFQTAHPKEYDAIVADAATAAVKGERTRVRAWQAFRGIDAEAVDKAIADGSEVDQAVMAEMAVKMANKQGLKDVAADSAADTPTSIPDAPKSKEDLEMEATTKKFLALL